jgi:hypothetical protein
MSSPNIAPFLPEQSFMTLNRDAITDVFGMLADDFPNRTIIVHDEELSTADALQVDSNDTALSEAAHEWLAVHTVGKQHGYDRPGDRLTKIFIEEQDEARYMRALAAVRFCGQSLVDGGKPDITTSGTNLFIGSGFPHLVAGRLSEAIDGEYERLHDVNSLVILSGQRRRWNDNPNEDTTDKVIERVAAFTGIDPETPEGSDLIAQWHDMSPFAYGQHLRRANEGAAWEQPYATEADMARAALELALLRAGNLFDWKNYPVQAHADPQAEAIDFEGFHVPAREVRAWEYELRNGRSAYIANGKAVARDKGGEPRPTSVSVMQEAVDIVGDQLQSHENIVAFGAPHIRAAVATAGQIIHMTNGESKPTHITNGPWEFHEPPVTGIASIAGADMVDGQIRSILRDLPA